MINALIFIGAIVCLIAGVLSVNIISKQKNKEWDTDIDKKIVRNPVRSNPGAVSYLLFPIIVIAGAIVLGIFWWMRG